MTTLDETKSNRRAFLKGTMYVVPVILTLKAKSAFASLGSSRPGGLGNEPPGPTGSGNPQGNPGGGGRHGEETEVSWADDFSGGQGRDRRNRGNNRGNDRDQNRGSRGRNGQQGNHGGGR